MKPSSDFAGVQIRTAIEVFVAGFAETKCRTWPYETIQHESVWQLRDRERKNSRDYRKEEWIAYGVAPGEVHAIAKQGTRGLYFIGQMLSLQDCAEELKSEFKALGYRLLASEPLFVHDLRRIPRSQCAASIQLLRTEKQALDFATANRIRPEKADVYSRDEYRQFLAYIDNMLVGWVRSIETEMGTWCSNLFVQPAFRRQGIARSLLCQMLRDDRKREAKRSVLLSSHTGALLYPQIGYQQLGTLFIFAPKK